jgi:hypothetical protein
LKASSEDPNLHFQTIGARNQCTKEKIGKNRQTTKFHPSAICPLCKYAKIINIRKQIIVYYFYKDVSGVLLYFYFNIHAKKEIVDSLTSMVVNLYCRNIFA